MFNFLTISLIIGYILITSASIISIIYIITHQKDYGSQLIVVLNILGIIFPGIIYSTFVIISLIFYPSEFLWKLSICFGFISFGITAIIYSFLKEYKKIPIFPYLCYTSLFGFLLGSLFLTDSVQIVNNNTNTDFLTTDISKINYIFNTTSGLLIIVFQILLLVYFLSTSIIINIKARNKELARGLLLNTLFISIPVLMYAFYIIFQLTIFRELHIFFLWLNLLGIIIMVIKKPEIFIVLTNKIYYLHIYHKSGILLYSYKFEKEEILSDSAIWGNILIGINHILSEFIDKKDQIDVMETKNSEIVVNYNNDYGFAVLVITNKKNDILKNKMESFIRDFKKRYETELNEIQDLNKMINVSEFEDTKEIIENNFQVYL